MQVVLKYQKKLLYIPNHCYGICPAEIVMTILNYFSADDTYTSLSDGTLTIIIVVPVAVALFTIILIVVVLLFCCVGR